MSESAPPDALWSLGYGSNMDKMHLEEIKGVKVYEAVPAKLPNFRLAFNVHAMIYAEPVFANAVPSRQKSDEIHGVAFCLGPNDAEKMDKVEVGYNKHSVTLESYDGRKLPGFVYVSKDYDPDNVPADGTPSQRYLNLLINGARAAGLDPDYIAKLEKTPVYKPSADTLSKRASLPQPADLPAVSVEDMARNKNTPDGAHWVGVLGYVFKSKVNTFRALHGRDITNRMLRHFYNLSSDAGDDLGRPPYPIISQLEKSELRPGLDYVHTWMDQLIHWSENTLVGYLKEFDEQQRSGKTTWSLKCG